LHKQGQNSEQVEQ